MIPLAGLLAGLGAEVVSSVIKEGAQWLKEQQVKGAIEDSVRLKIANDMMETANVALQIKSALLRDPDAVDRGVLVPDPTVPVPPEHS